MKGLNMDAQILVDIRNMRCSYCKVLVKDELAIGCSFCGCIFDGVTSNHVGLAKRLMGKRGEKIVDFGIELEHEDRCPELVGG